MVLKWLLITATGKKLCMFIAQVSLGMELFESLEYYSEDALEMVVRGDTGKDCIFIFQISRETELFKLL